MPKAFSEREKALIRKRLLEEGYRLFSIYGLKKTNVEEIALASGISKGAFYLFYESKEALFMDIIEQTETRVRQELMAVIELPGPTPRARLFAILKKAFTLFRTIPMLQFFTGGDIDLLLRKLPAEKFQEHLANDRVFFDELITRCQDSGIPIQAPMEQIMGLLYQVLLSVFHEDELSRNNFGSSTDLLLELVAAFCLGEVEIQLQHSNEIKLNPESGD